MEWTGSEDRYTLSSRTGSEDIYTLSSRIYQPFQYNIDQIS